jgi:hypothetical protein
MGGLRGEKLWWARKEYRGPFRFVSFCSFLSYYFKSTNFGDIFRYILFFIFISLYIFSFFYLYNFFYILDSTLGTLIFSFHMISYMVTRCTQK